MENTKKFRPTGRIIYIRDRRAKECFSVINRGNPQLL